MSPYPSNRKGWLCQLWCVKLLVKNRRTVGEILDIDIAWMRMYCSLTISVVINDLKLRQFRHCLFVIIDLAKYIVILQMSSYCFQFSVTAPFSPKSDSYRASPSLADQCHVVALVVDGSSSGVITSAMLDKVRTLRMHANHRGK